MPTRISEFHWMRPNKTWRLMSMKTMGYVFHWYRRILKDFYFTYWRFVWKFQARLLWHRSMSDHWCRSTGVFAKHPTSRCLIGSLFVRKERPRRSNSTYDPQSSPSKLELLTVSLDPKIHNPMSFSLAQKGPFEGIAHLKTIISYDHGSIPWNSAIPFDPFGLMVKSYGITTVAS